MQDKLFLINSIKHELILRRCETDYLYFINNFVKTLDMRTEDKVLPFKLYDFQQKFVKEVDSAYQNKHDIIIDKSRDMGATWCVLAYIFWKWLFGNNVQILIGSRKEDAIKGEAPDTLFGKLFFIYKHLPSFLQIKGFKRLRDFTSMQLRNKEKNNYIKGESSNQDFSVSGRYNMIFLDEFSKWENDEKVFMVTADSSPCRVFLGTPNGMGNTFASIRFGGKTRHLEFHWRLHPEKGAGAWFDETEQIWRSEWYDKEILRRMNDKESSIQNIKQELDINYLQSGDPVFPLKYLIKHQLTKHHPNPYEGYAIGVDVASGQAGEDLSSFDILAKSTGEQVYSWEGKISTFDLAKLVVQYANKYNKALVCVEINGGGISVVEKIKELRYKKIYRRSVMDKYSSQTTQTIHWYTTSKNKSAMIEDLQSALTLGEIKIIHQKTLTEMSYYQLEETGTVNKYSSPKGKHDDKVMSLAIAWQCLKQVKKPLTRTEAIEKEQRKKEFRKKLKLCSPVCGY